MKRAYNIFANYIDNLQSQGQYFFLRQGTIAKLGISKNAFKLAVNRLSKKGRVHRIHANFYVIIPLEYKAINCLPASWFIDFLMQHMGTHYYVGILSAAALHGAAHQQPMVFQVIADKRISSIRAGQLRIDFHYKKTIKTSFSNAVKTETGTMQVATPEITICDIVRYMDAAGQVNNVATIIYELRENIDITQLLKYVKKGYIETAVIQRLGHLMEYLNLGLDLTKLARWVKNKNPHYRALVTDSSGVPTRRDSRWRIIVNETAEADI